jgi:hypothetical protein
MVQVPNLNPPRFLNEAIRKFAFYALNFYNCLMEIVKSINNVPIRLTDERWLHIIENHDDLAGYYDEVLELIENPDYVIKGYKEALMSLRCREDGKFLGVIYKETDDSDGFFITVYLTSKIKLEREVIVWQRQQ